jgi:hypothetical protein
MIDPQGIRLRLESRSTEELRSILQERDEEEWRPEVFPLIESILCSRRVSTRSASAEKPTPVEAGPSRVSVGLFRHEEEAEEAKALLESEGIQVWLSHESISTSSGLEVGTNLQVEESDSEAASGLLQAFDEAQPILPSADAPGTKRHAGFRPPRG